MKAVHCDRCKKVIVRKYALVAYAEDIDARDANVTIDWRPCNPADLCLSCVEEFKKWMNTCPHGNDGSRYPCGPCTLLTGGPIVESLDRIPDSTSAPLQNFVNTKGVVTPADRDLQLEKVSEEILRSIWLTIQHGEQHQTATVSCVPGWKEMYPDGMQHGDAIEVWFTKPLVIGVRDDALGHRQTVATARIHTRKGQL